MNKIICTIAALTLTLISLQSTFARSTRKAIDSTMPRVVKIFGSGGVKGLHAYGTGFLVSNKGHIATIWNHVLDSDEVTVVTNDGRHWAAKVMGAEPQLDLAVLEIIDGGEDFPFFDLKQVKSATTGTRVLGFSNMFKVATGNEPVSVIHGVIEAKTKLSARKGAFEVPYQGEVYVVDAITNNPGAGGGVLTDHRGNLLGMIGKELRNTESNTWINYAIPVTKLGSIIDQIISGKYISDEKNTGEEENPNRYNALDFGIVMMPDVLYKTPAYIGSVISGSAADSALNPEGKPNKLQRDDLILFVNEELVQSNRTLKEQLGKLEAGDTLRLIVRRKDKLVEIEMPIKAKEENK